MPAAITAAGAGIPRQVAFVGGAPTGGVGVTTSANNQQLLSAVLASGLLQGGGAPGSVASNNNMPQPQPQHSQLPALNAVNAVDTDVLLRTLLAQRLQQQQQQQQQKLQAAALAELVQRVGGGGGVSGVSPPTNQGTGTLTYIPTASLANIDPGSILALLRGQQLGPQQQHRQVFPTALVAPHPRSRPQPGVAFTAAPSLPINAPAAAPPSMAPLNNNDFCPVLTLLQQMQQQSHPPAQQERLLPAAGPTAPTPSVQVMQAMLYQRRQAATALAGVSPQATTSSVDANSGGPGATASLSIGTEISSRGGTQPDPGRSEQGQGNNSYAMGHALGLLAKALLAKNQGPEQSK